MGVPPMEERRRGRQASIILFNGCTSNGGTQKRKKPLVWVHVYLLWRNIEEEGKKASVILLSGCPMDEHIRKTKLVQKNKKARIILNGRTQKRNKQKKVATTYVKPTLSRINNNRNTQKSQSPLMGACINCTYYGGTLKRIDR